MKNYCLKNLCVLVVFSLLIFGCEDDEKRIVPDVSDISVSLDLVRYEQTLFTLDTNAVFVEEFQRLHTAHPEFTELFSENILGTGPIENPSTDQLDYWSGFVRFPAVRHLYDTVQVVFPDLSIYEKEFTDALKLFTYYFPETKAPEEITSFISEYSYAAFIYGDNSLAIGLDMFLGENYPYAKYNPGNPYFSNYLVRSYNKDHLVSKTIQVLVDDMVGEPIGGRLLDLMVNNGKKLYILDQLLPYAPDTIKLEVTTAQNTWLQESEFQMWTYFQTEELLYSSRMKDINKLVEHSPSGSPILPEESPGRSANYVGFQIVKQFMKNNPHLPLSELLNYRDAQEILDMSKYKPRR